MANSFPWTGEDTGDAGPYDDQDWRRAWRQLAGGGGHADAIVVPHSGTAGTPALSVVPQSPTAAKEIVVNPGVAFAEGLMIEIPSRETITVADNNTGATRIDTIILQVTITAQTGRVVNKQGTTAPPLLTRSAAIKEYALADLSLAASFTTIAASDITPRSMYLQGYGISSIFLQNNTGSTIEPGRAVQIDTANDQSMELATSTVKCIGVTTGRTEAPSGGSSTPIWGQVVTGGLALIYVGDTVSNGDKLVVSSTDGVLTGITNDVLGGVGYFLEPHTGSGFVLGSILKEASSSGLALYQYRGDSITLTTTARTHADTSATLTISTGKVRVWMKGNRNQSANSDTAFTIDGVTGRVFRPDSNSGQQTVWEHIFINVSAGSHTFVARHSSDSGGTTVNEFVVQEIF